MFFKRPGVLKTKNMMKIFEKYDVEESFRELLSKNQKNAEEYQAVEIFSKKLLDKISSKSEEIELEYKNYIGYEDIKGKNMLKSLHMNEDDDLYLYIIRYALGYKDVKVISAPKSKKADINKLYAAAKNKKRELKDRQQKISNNLKKWKKLNDKALVMANKLRSEHEVGGTVGKGGLESDDVYNRCKKNTEKYNNLVGDMLEIKDEIKKLFKDCGFKDTEIDNVLESFVYPKIGEVGLGEKTKPGEY